jgi:hypothetical protein
MWTLLAIGLGLAALNAIVQYATQDRNPLPPDAAPEFDPAAQFPVVTESTPIPVVFGTRMVASPNVVYMGGFSTPLEELRTGPGNLEISFGKKRRFKLDMVFSVCVGPVDAIRRVDVGGEPILGTADVGDAPAFDLTTGPTDVIVNGPRIFTDQFPFQAFNDFDGDDGLAGRIEVSPGGPAHNLLSRPDAYGNSTVVFPDGQLRGVVSVTLRGLPNALAEEEAPLAHPFFYHGTSPQLRPWRFLVERTLVRQFGIVQWYDTKARITVGDLHDMNPVHILRELLVDELGLDDSTIDNTSFEEAADALHDEDLGMSILWNREASVDDLITEIERTIDGAVYRSDSSGLWKIRLVRDDFDAGTIAAFDVGNIVEVVQYPRPWNPDLVNTVHVVYWDRREQRERTYTVHDQAAIASRGKIIAETIRYPGVVEGAIIRKLAHRDLIQLSRERAYLTLRVVPEDALGLERTDPIRVTYPAFGIDTVFRVVSLNWGTITEATVTLELIEDVFAARPEFYAGPNESDHEDPRQDLISIDSPWGIQPPFAVWAARNIERGIAWDTSAELVSSIVAFPETSSIFRAGSWFFGWRPLRNGLEAFDHTEFDLLSRRFGSGLTPLLRDRADFARRVVVTEPLDRPDDDAVQSTLWVPSLFVDESQPYRLRVGDLLWLPCQPQLGGLEFIFGGSPNRDINFDHLTEFEEEIVLVVEVVDDDEVKIVRGCFDTVVHQRILAGPGYVIGNIDCTELDSGAWFEAELATLQRRYALGPTRDIAPFDSGVEEEARALTIAQGRRQGWSDAAAINAKLDLPNTNTFPRRIPRALRPISPGSVVCDDSGSRVVVTAQPRDYRVPYFWPLGLASSSLANVPDFVLEGDYAIEDAGEVWFFDGADNQLIRVQKFNSSGIAEYDEEHNDHNAKYSSSQKFSNLIVCVLANDFRPALDIALKDLPSYQFTRFDIERL